MIRVGLGLLIFGIIIGAYFIPVMGENYYKEKELDCMDEYIFFAYDFLQREEMTSLGKNIYMLDWLERCDGWHVDWDKRIFLDRVKELGY